MYLSGGITDKEHRRAHTQRGVTATGDCDNGLRVNNERAMMEKLSSQERIFVITQNLYENHTAGLSNKELSQILGTSETNICRDMALFEKYKWVVRNEKGRWRLSPVFCGIAGQVMKAYQKARLLLSEEEAKYAVAMQ